MVAQQDSMNADTLVLRWVETKLPQWFNERIERLNEWLERSPKGPSAVSWQKELTVLSHLYTCPLKKVIAPEHGWVCDCYSEYTKCDNWEVHAVIVCGHMLAHEYFRRFSDYEVPDMLQELYELDESDCPWKDEDE